MTKPPIDTLPGSLEEKSPQDLLRWAVQHNEPGRVVLGTSFQLTGVAMIHMVAQANLDIRIATINTLRLHPETIKFLRHIEDHFEVQIEIWRPDREKVSKMVERHGEYLFFDSQEKREYCCHVRKVEPNLALLKTADCWISGLRRDQSKAREDAKKASFADDGTGRKIIKLNPLVDWDEERLMDYINDNAIPIHPLYNHGYESIGCFICSTPTLPHEDKRAGRWRWFNGPSWRSSEECGIHLL